MKKSIIVVGIAAFALLFATSCKKENLTSKVVLKAGIESSPAKTYVDIVGPFTSWSENDHILVNGNEMYISERYETKYQDENHVLKVGYHTADFTCDNWNGPKPGVETQLYAIYPATKQEQNANGTWKSLVSLPATQLYRDGGFMDNVPMAVSNSGSLLNFKNVTCVLGVPVRTDKTNLHITKVVLRNMDSEPSPLVADIWYPHWGNETQNIEIIGSESSEITLKISENQNDGVLIQTDNKGTEFYFVVFPVSVSKLQIDFYSGNERVASISKTLSGELEAGTIYDLVKNPNPDDRTPWNLDDYAPQN